VKPAGRAKTAPRAPAASTVAGRAPLAAALLRPLIWAASAALLILLLYQLPAAHRVDVGAYDAAYTQGFHDAERVAEQADPAPYLQGSDGSARWTTGSAALIFPQAGLPGEVRLRLRGWREAGTPPTVTLLLNGTSEMGRLQTSGEWEEVAMQIRGGWLKATDFYVELRADTTELADGREVGVLVDEASYTVGPGLTAPYPGQLAYGAAVGALLWALLRRPALALPAQAAARPALVSDLPGRRLWALVGALLSYGLVWLVLYRLQPPFYPYPLRLLPPLSVAALAAALALRDGPAIAARAPWLLASVASVVTIAAWTAATLLVGPGHVTLSRPGVENDFRVFATRETLGQIFSADGFYNLGYPLLLWLMRPLTSGNPFLAGQLVAALSGALLLGAGYWLARALLPPAPALLALVALALSSLVAQYGLYVGSDMPFAACVALCAAALLAGDRGQGTGARLWLFALAGLCGGLAFLMRHLGLVLLPWGLIAIVLMRTPDEGRRKSDRGLWASGYWRQAATFALAFLLAMAPQLIINTVQAGQPLYNQQAKNIWLAVYGGTDWGRWDEAPNSIGLAEVVLSDPARFLGNWWRNMVGFVGSGAEDTSEFGRALQLRLLGWPANWLAVGGLLGWMVLLIQPWDNRRATTDGRPGQPARHLPLATRHPTPDTRHLALLLLILIYSAAVSTAFTLQRFFLPLAPIYAVAAGWALWKLTGGGRLMLGAALALCVVLWGGYGAGAGYVLANQPADEVAAVTMAQGALPPDALLAARVASRLPLAKYSALAHRVVDWPAGSDLETAITAADLETARAAGATYLLWDEATGLPPLPSPEAQRRASSGRYALYQLDQ
jgi:4-amino-4-deoxy-L-arabinose transferase-like glycosyltransferase